MMSFLHLFLEGHESCPFGRTAANPSAQLINPFLCHRSSTRSELLLTIFGLVVQGMDATSCRKNFYHAAACTLTVTRLILSGNQSIQGPVRYSVLNSATNRKVWSEKKQELI
jgi:hypothetical protein